IAPHLETIAIDDNDVLHHPLTLELDHAEARPGRTQPRRQRARSHLHHRAPYAWYWEGERVVDVPGDDRIDLRRGAALQRLIAAFCLDRDLRQLGLVERMMADQKSPRIFRSLREAMQRI